MTTFRKLVKKSRGMEALQAVLLLGAAFFVICALKDFGSKAKGNADKQMPKIMSSSETTSNTGGE